jgi:hypothetical protein
MSDLFGDTFGNYMLHGIEEIQLSGPVPTKLCKTAKLFRQSLF